MHLCLLSTYTHYAVVSAQYKHYAVVSAKFRLRNSEEFPAVASAARCHAPGCSARGQMPCCPLQRPLPDAIQAQAPGDSYGALSAFISRVDFVYERN